MLFKIIFILILLQILATNKMDKNINYVVLAGLITVAYYLYSDYENFSDIQNLCPPCPKCPEMPDCPPCPDGKDRKWDMPRWSFLSPDDMVKAQHKPALCANAKETKTDYYSPTDYTEFLNAFEDTRVGSNLPRETPVTDYF
jgi:hypothetical protein